MSKKKKFKLKNNVVLLIVAVLIISIVAGVGFWFFKYKSENMKKLANVYFEGLNDKQEVGRSVTDIKYNMNCSHVIRYPEVGIDSIDENIKDKIDTLESDFISEFGSDTDFDGMEKLTYYQYIDYESYLGPDYTLSIIFHESIESNDENVIKEVNHVLNYDINTGDVLKSSYLFKGDYKSKLTNYLDKYLTSTDKYKDSLNSDYKNIITKDHDYRYSVTNDGIKVYFDKYEICNGSLGLISITVPYSELSDVMNIDTSKKTSKLKPNTGVKATNVTYKSVNKNKYIKSLVNFYSKDSKNSNLIGNISMGEKVFVIEESNTSWSKIKYNDKYGYVSTSFLSDEAVADSGYTAVDETVYAISSVNVRSKASTEGDKLATLKVGDSVQRIGKGDNGWSEVKYNGDKAYIYSSYLSTSKPVDNTPVKVDPQRGIDPNKPMVALSFDDGPNPIATPRIIATLAKYNAVGTFFDLGNLITSHPSVVKSEEANGNEVGSHTYDHANLNKLSVDSLNWEMSQSEAAFKSVLGHGFSIVRPPYGNANDTVKANVKYPLINWDIDTLDWKSRNKDAILSEFRCTDNYDGKIILMHSIYGTTADAVEVIVPELISKGYQLVTISEMAAYKGVSLQAGRVYYSF